MDELEGKIRESLHSLAEGVPTHRALPAATRRRARRGMAVSALGIALVVTLTISGGYAGIRVLTAPGPPVPASSPSCEWTRVPSPNVGVSAASHLVDLAVVSDDDVWAVGGWTRGLGESGGPEMPLVQHWDGTAWNLTPLPEGNGGFGMRGVSAVSSDDVWAVGSTDLGDEGDRPRVLHWDGSAWEDVPTPDPGKTYAHLSSISAVATDDVWAVGGWATGRGEAGTLTMHWDGSSWSIVASPDPPPRPRVGWSYPGLVAVVALSSDNVWAVGDSENVAPAGPSNTLIEHWDGTVWSLIPSPDVSGAQGLPFNHLASVGGAAPDDVWAVGSFGQDLNDDPYTALPERTLAEHWDGSEWSVVSTPALEGRNALNGVAAISATEAWAVGSLWEGASQFPLVEHWDGSEWAIIPVPIAQNASLSAVAATPSGNLWTVGTASIPGGDRWGTLALHADCAH